MADAYGTPQSTPPTSGCPVLRFECGSVKTRAFQEIPHGCDEAPSVTVVYCDSGDLRGFRQMIESTVLGLTDGAWAVWACLMALWTGVQCMLNLVKLDEG